MSRITIITASLAVCLCWLFAGTAQAASGLNEFEGAPFSVAVHPRLPLRMVPASSETALIFAGVLPGDSGMMDLLEVKWPKSSRTCLLAFDQTGFVYGKPGAPQGIAIATAVDGANAALVRLPAEMLQGMVGRICIWPCGESGEEQLMFLISFSTGAEDSRIAGFTLSLDGRSEQIDTGMAATVYGWFECIDLDGDGLYELVTSRNLDGMAGGLCYHSVRTYDPATQKFAPAPDRFKPFFEAEVKWLNWLIDTKTLIQANPEAYLSKTGNGPQYVATYENRVFGFDTLIEVPVNPGSEETAKAINAARRKSFGLVQSYRDELRGWLAGGAYPSAWKMR